MSEKEKIDKQSLDETIILSKKNFDNIDEHTMVLPKIKEDEFKDKDKKDYEKEQKDVFEKIEDRYKSVTKKKNNDCNEIKGNKRTNNTKTKSKRISFYKTTWFMVIMLFILTPIGIILLWLNKNIKIKTKKRLTIVFVLYFVCILYMPKIKNIIFDARTKIESLIPNNNNDLKEESNTKENNDNINDDKNNTNSDGKKEIRKDNPKQNSNENKAKQNNNENKTNNNQDKENSKIIQNKNEESRPPKEENNKVNQEEKTTKDSQIIKGQQPKEDSSNKPDKNEPEKSPIGN